jgi:DNA polymerase-3 subunit alpha
MGSDGFVHLHNHTEFSLLDGASRIRDLVGTAAEQGSPAVAVTDHGVMFGALDFYQAAREAGVKPIIGVEAYVAPASRFDRERGDDDEAYRHLTVLARDAAGYKNLLQVVTDASIQGFYHRPRTDKEFLAEHAEGLTALSGCLASETARLLLAGNHDRARQVVSDYRDLFGPGNFYLELQDHGIPEQHRLNPLLLELSAETGIPVVATNDIHYIERDGARPHDVLLCIQQQRVQSDTARLKFDTDEFYLKTPQEMRALFSQWPEACDATLAIAESVDLSMEFGKLHLPRFDPPDGMSLDAYLSRLVYEGAVVRYGEISAEIRARIDAELTVIGNMGFAGYFLIVWDLIRFARERGIRVGPGRGSAAGSVVSYCLRITDLDPLRYGLIFERFLNPDRKQMPDIDMDFDVRGRDQVIQYVADRYGAVHVAQIITFQTIKGKQGIRDAARVLGFPASMGDRLCKMYPPAVLGREYSIEDALKLSPELRDAYEKEPEAREVVDTARALEGLRREDSVHAAGVVIGDVPLVNYLPLKLTKDSRDDSRRVVTQFDMHGVEKLGLLKMDFLGLRNLSVIEDTVRLLADRGTPVDVDHLPLDDAPTYEMLRKGDTVGVFQLEGGGMRSLIRQLEPDRFEDLMALNALYRPGPLNAGMHVEYAERKGGRRPVTYPHPTLEHILADTYGIMVYQEQIMQTAVQIAGYSMGQADELRRVMAKKKRELVGAERERFVAGCAEQGHPEKLGKDLFDRIEPFADYGFPAAHACAYALIGYQTAYLKRHHPLEYMSALLTSVEGDKDNKPFYLNAARLMGIRVLPPDVNESVEHFAPAGEDVRYGLAAVRNVGEGAVQQIILARRNNGAFTSFKDFCEKVEPGVLHKKSLESLILAGAFDSLGYTRRGLLEGYERVVTPIIGRRRAEASGQESLFGGDAGVQLDEIDESRVITDVEFDRDDLLRQEKEMLGQYVTDHPLLAVKDHLARVTSMEIVELSGPEVGDGDVLTLGGIIGSVGRKFTKRGEQYAVVRLEDLTGGVGVVVFPSLYEQAAGLIAPDRIVLVKGRVDLRGRELQLVALEITEPNLRTSSGGGPIVRLPESTEPFVVDIPVQVCTEALIRRLKDLLGSCAGSRPVTLCLVDEHGSQRLRLGQEFSVDGSAGLLSELRHLLGPGAVRDAAHDPVRV